MKIDIDELTKEQLLELNSRIVERLRLLDDAGRDVGSQDLKERFHEMLLESYGEVGRATGYWAHRFRQKVVRVGGWQAARDWLAKKEVPSGFDRVIDVGRQDLALESIVLDDPWNQLFTPAELAIARRRLEQAIARRQTR